MRSLCLLRIEMIRSRESMTEIQDQAGRLAVNFQMHQDLASTNLVVAIANEHDITFGAA